jgi:hypothetical protein
MGQVYLEMLKTIVGWRIRSHAGDLSRPTLEAKARNLSHRGRHQGKFVIAYSAGCTGAAAGLVPATALPPQPPYQPR